VPVVYRISIIHANENQKRETPFSSLSFSLNKKTMIKEQKRQSERKEEMISIIHILEMIEHSFFLYERL
jgi:hypothetical protein